MKYFETTTRKAIILARELLRIKLNRKMLVKYRITGSYIDCDCGQSSAITLWAGTSDGEAEIKVGVCKACTKTHPR